jgi:hypothetical protein
MLCNHMDGGGVGGGDTARARRLNNVPVIITKTRKLRHFEGTCRRTHYEISPTTDDGGGGSAESCREA